MLGIDENIVSLRRENSTVHEKLADLQRKDRFINVIMQGILCETRVKDVHIAKSVTSKSHHSSFSYLDALGKKC